MLVYCVHNTVNGKSYVGQTRQTLRARWKSHQYEAKRGSSRYFCRAIRKHGAEAFEVSTLAVAENQQQLDLLEELWIAMLATNIAAFGYNRRPGKDGALCEESLKQMATSKRGRCMSEAEKEKRRHPYTPWSEEAKAGWKGHKKSDTTRQNMATAARGNHRRLGKTSTPAQKENYRKAAILREAKKRGQVCGTNS